MTFSNAFLEKFQEFLGKALLINRRTDVYFVVTRLQVPFQVFSYQNGVLTLYNYEDGDLDPLIPKITIPNVVLKDAVLKNMFHHAGISKRVSYWASNAVGMKSLRGLVRELEAFELTGDQRHRFFLRLLGMYVRRWRELVTYFRAAYLYFLFQRPSYEVEEIILGRKDK